MCVCVKERARERECGCEGVRESKRACNSAFSRTSEVISRLIGKTNYLEEHF